MEGLHWAATLDNEDFIQKMDAMRKGIDIATAQVERGGAEMQRSFDGAKSSLMGLATQFGLGFSAVGFVKQVVAVRGQFQQLESSFKTLLGSEQQANDLMQQLVRTAATTPFDLKGVSEGAKQLLAYGTSADKVNDKIVQLGNLASGLSLNLGEVVNLYGTTVTKDFVDSLDIKQFQNRGIAIKKALADVLKLDEANGSISAQIDALVTARKITPEIFEKAIANMTSMNGQFAGMMENQSKTIAGQISNIEDAIDSMFNEIGKESESVISDVLSGVSYVVENYKEIGEYIAEAVGAYGAYRAALMVVTAYQETNANQLSNIATSIQTETQAENVNTATKERNALATSQNTMATKAKSTAVAIDTSNTTKNTFATRAQMTATTLLTRAQTAFGKALKASGIAGFANPAMLAAAAFTALGYGIYKAVTYENDFTKAQKRMSEGFKEATSGAADEISQLHQLTDALQNSEKGTEEYEMTKGKIIEQFGQYHKGLADEIDQLTTESELYDKLTASVLNHYMQKAKAKATEEANETYGAEVSESISSIKAHFDKLQKEEEKDAGGDLQKLEDIRTRYVTSFATIRKAILEGKASIDNATQELKGVEIDEAIASKLRVKKVGEYGFYYHNLIYNDIAKIKEAAELRQRVIEEAEAVYGETSKTDENKDKTTDTEAPKEVAAKYKGLQDLIKKITEAEKELNDVRAKARTGQTRVDKDSNKIVPYTAEDVADAEKKVKELKDAYEKITQINWDGRMAAVKAIRDAEEEVRKAQEEIDVSEVEFRQRIAKENTDIELSLEADSMAKRLKVREQKNNEEIEAIRKNGEERKKEVVEQAKQLFEAEQKVLEEKAKASGNRKFVAESFDETAYRNSDEYATKSANIDIVVNSRVDNAREKQKQEGQQEYQKDLLERQAYYSKLIEIETDYQKELNTIREAEVAGALTNEQAQNAISIATQNRANTLSDAGYTAEMIAQNMTEVEAVAEQIVIGNIDELQSIVLELQTKIQELKDNGGDSEEIAAAQAKLAQVNKQLTDVTSRKISPDKRDTKNWQKYEKVVRNCTEVARGLGDVFGDDFAEIADLATKIAEMTMTIISSILTLTIGAETSMTGTSIAAAESIKTVEKASVILAIIEAALQIVQAIINLVKSEDTQAAFEGAKRNYEAYMDILDDVINKNVELAQSAQGDAETSALEKSKQYYAKALESAKLQEQAARELGVASMNAGAGHFEHSHGYNVWESLNYDDWKQAADAIGMSVDDFYKMSGGRVTGIYSLSVEQIDKLLANAPMFLAKLGDDSLKLLQDISKYGQSQTDIMMQQMEQTIGYSIETLREDFTDLFTDLDDDGDTFTENFSEKLKNAIVGDVISNEFASRLEALAKKQKQLTDEGNAISVEDYKILMQEAQKIEADRKARMEELNKMYSFDDYVAEEQEATYGGFETMSEDTGTELSGRFSAMYIVQSEHLAVAREMLSNIAAGQALLDTFARTAQDALTLHGQTNMLVQDILVLQRASYTEITDTLNKINKNTQSLQ